MSSLGLMPFFIEFLKTSGRLDEWVEDCPRHYTSGHAPEKRDVLETLLLSVLAGHWRYAHINALRGDGINPELLGMTTVTSEDSVRRGMKAMDEVESGVVENIWDQLRAAAAGALGIRSGYHGEAVIRTPARRRGRIHARQRFGAAFIPFHGSRVGSGCPSESRRLSRPCFRRAGVSLLAGLAMAGWETRAAGG